MSLEFITKTGHEVSVPERVDGDIYVDGALVASPAVHQRRLLIELARNAGAVVAYTDLFPELVEDIASDDPRVAEAAKRETQRWVELHVLKLIGWFRGSFDDGDCSEPLIKKADGGVYLNCR